MLERPFKPGIWNWQVKINSAEYRVETIGCAWRRASMVLNIYLLDQENIENKGKITINAVCWI